MRRLAPTTLLALALAFALPLAAGGCGGGGDEVQRSLELANTLRPCERCGLFRSDAHRCGETAYCPGCYAKALNESRAYLAEGKFKVDPATRLASCETCGQPVGQKRE